jgi:hypothetical protein
VLRKCSKNARPNLCTIRLWSWCVAGGDIPYTIWWRQGKRI